MNIGLTNETIKTLNASLSAVLADQTIIHNAALACHWNVTGSHFSSLHVFFEEQYTALRDQMDEVAERLRQLDQDAPATLHDILELKRIDEFSTKELTQEGFIEKYLNSSEAIIRTLRADIETVSEDVGSVDLLTRIIQFHEKSAWMLRSMLER